MLFDVNWLMIAIFDQELWYNNNLMFCRGSMQLATTPVQGLLNALISPRAPVHRTCVDSSPGRVFRNSPAPVMLETRPRLRIWRWLPIKLRYSEWIQTTYWLEFGGGFHNLCREETMGLLIDGVVQDCGISSASALEIPPSCTSHHCEQNVAEILHWCSQFYSLQYI